MWVHPYQLWLALKVILENFPHDVPIGVVQFSASLQCHGRQEVRWPGAEIISRDLGHGLLQGPPIVLSVEKSLEVHFLQSVSLPAWSADRQFNQSETLSQIKIKRLEYLLTFKTLNKKKFIKINTLY
jgi:hypothetical protein